MHDLRRWFAAALAIAASSLLIGSAHAQAPLDWEPGSTCVFTVGMLQWVNSQEWSPAPQTNRRDQHIVNFFAEAGVPPEQIASVRDAGATKQRMLEELVRLLRRTRRGDMLVFYFCGHGARDVIDSDEPWFGNFDSGEQDDLEWNASEVLNAIEQHFRGDRVLLLAESCRSGALYEEVLSLARSRIGYAVLTSAYSPNTSTASWTFTDAILSGLRGNGIADVNGDRVVDLEELAEYAELEVAFIQGQKSMALARDGFPGSTRLAVVMQAVPDKVGLRLEVRSHKGWHKAESINVNGENLEVEFVQEGSDLAEWVGPDQVRLYQPTELSPGTKVDVLWNGDQAWYPGTVVQAWYGLHLVRYDGDDGASNEWVGPQSLRLRGR